MRRPHVLSRRAIRPFVARAGLCVGILVGALGLTACGEPPALLSGYNLVLVNIDSLRADHLGTYGYARDTSPFIDHLAEHGVVFENALSNSSFTRESVAVLMSGRLPTVGGSVGWEAGPAPGTLTLAERLQQAGYRTGFFSNTPMLSDPRFTRGFDAAHHLAEAWGLSGMGPLLSRRAAEFVGQEGDGPFMLYLHYLDPHGPYQARSGAPEKVAKGLGIYRDVRPRRNELVAEGFGPGDPRFEDLVARYDAEISHTDRALASLMRALREQGVVERTLLVVTADHGEEFLEHDFVEHAWTLYRESLHVPLVFWAPGALEPRRVPGLVSTVDVAPTILDLLGVSAGEGRLDPFDRLDRLDRFDGVPLLGRDGAPPQAPEERTYIGELLIRERNVLRTVIRGNWKYVAAHRWLPPEARPEAAAREEEERAANAGPPQPLWGSVVHEELYRLADDPAEKRNVVARFPEKAAELRAELDAYRRRSEREGAPVTGRPDAPEPLDDAERERLRALGYL